MERNGNEGYKMDFVLHNKAEAWHRDYLRWAEKYGVTNTDEYRITKYALECIQMRLLCERQIEKQK